MASINNTTLFDDAIESDATTLGTTFTIPVGATDFIFTSVVSSRVDGTYFTSLEHSQDGSLWFATSLADVQVEDGGVLRFVDSVLLKYVRASILSASVSHGASMKVVLSYDLRT